MTRDEYKVHYKAARERIDSKRADPNYARQPIDDTMDRIVDKMKKQVAAACEGSPLTPEDGMLAVESLMKSFTWDEKAEADILMQEAVESYHAEKAAKE